MVWGIWEDTECLHPAGEPRHILRTVTRNEPASEVSSCSSIALS